jgi:hypothetical protein
MPIARNLLFDSGPLVAPFDSGDQWHARCIAVWPAIGKCITLLPEH